MSQVLLMQGNAMHLPLKDGSCHVCVTSPPYYALRSYGIGAENGELGMEDTIHGYVEAMVQVFREVKRVLRDDGVLWLNLGDSYAGSWGNYGGQTRGHGHQRPIGAGSQALNKAYEGLEQWRPPSSFALPGLPAKNLIGIPWRVAFGLQDDGWILRSDCIWEKGSCMPESMQDRPTRSHEYLFLFAKQPHYFYDATAIREPNSGDMQRRASLGHSRGAHGKLDASRMDKESLRGEDAMTIVADGRNARTVWHINPEGFTGSHFATFPTALVRKCLLAGTPSSVCAHCAAPYRRITETVGYQRQRWAPGVDQYHTQAKGRHGVTSSFSTGDVAQKTTTGFSPTCTCSAGVGKSVVFDPFVGSGTTLLVARELGHDAIGTDLSYPYLHDIARERLGLADLARWEGNAKPSSPVDMSDLPLFGGGA